MDLGKIPALVVGLIISILIVSAVAIPIINESADTVKTAGINTSNRYVVVDAEDTFKIESTGTTGSFIINGETQNVTYFRLLCDTISIYLNPNTSEIMYPGMTGVVSFSTTAGNYINFENGNWTLHTSTLDVTKPYTWLLHSSDTGDYGLYAATSSTSIMVDNDAKIYASQIQSTNEGAVARPAYIVSGTINDGFSGVYFSYSNGASQTYNLTASAKLNGEKGVVSSDLNNLTVDFNGTSVPAIVVYAPLTYHYVSDMDNSIRTIISIIPVLLIVSLLMAIVGTVFVRTQ